MVSASGMRVKTGEYSSAVVPAQSGQLPVYDEAGVVHLIPNVGGGSAPSDQSKFTLEDGSSAGLQWLSSPSAIPIGEDTTVTERAGASRGSRAGGV